MGTIEQKWHPFVPKFDICDGDGNTVLQMKGPVCSLSCCRLALNFSEGSINVLLKIIRIDLGAQRLKD